MSEIDRAELRRRAESAASSLPPKQLEHGTQAGVNVGHRDLIALLDAFEEAEQARDQWVVNYGVLTERVVTAEREREMLGNAALAALRESGEDLDGARTWQDYFRPLRSTSWEATVSQSVALLAQERDAAERALDTHACGENVEAVYRRTLRAELALERVRAMHRVAMRGREGEPVRCLCDEPWPCATVTALEGA